MLMGFECGKMNFFMLTSWDSHPLRWIDKMFMGVECGKMNFFMPARWDSHPLRLNITKAALIKLGGFELPASGSF
jgi:hypothetical protein